MKRLLKYLLLLPLIAGAVAFSSTVSKKHEVFETHADQVYTYPGNSGTILLVGGANTYFAQGVANVAIYCFNSSSDNAWSDASSYRIGDNMRIMVPYQNGTAKSWSKLIICRYNPGMNPKSDGWSGVYNQTEDLSFSDLIYNQNTFVVNGYGSGNLITVNTIKSATYYNGIKSDNHAYLDLSAFQGWEDGNAKFALFFGAPDYYDASEWGKSNSSEGYYSSFMWRVQGQDNSHLYECIVPSYGNGSRLWNLVIAVRFNPNTESPYWTDDSSVIWNKTGDLQFIPSNHNANMIHINDWNGGYIDGDNIIARSSKVGFYGQYFLDTVSCSGHGNSDSTTSNQWNAVKAEYINHLSKTFQGDVWTTVADKSASASTIAQAMARYDYIILYKEYDHEDFINRKGSPNKTEYPASEMYAGLQPYASDKNSSIYIVVIALASITTLGLLVVIKRKKVQNR